MKKSVMTEFILYRYRYAIGYGMFVITLISLLAIAGFFIPGQLSQAEMTSTVASVNFSLTDISSWPIINLPYHLLQRASISLFGLSTIAIKLPSLILALATGVGFLFLLRHWFKNNVAVLASIIAVTASQFLITAQSGTATILLLFWSTFLLLAATYTSLKAKKGFIWKLLFFATAALSLYTPLSIYVLVAMAIAAVWHPHLRFMLLRLSFVKVLTCIILASVLLIPLGWHIIQSPSVAWTLLGLPTEVPTWQFILGNLQYLVHAFLGFTTPVMRDDILLPLYSMSAAALMTLGFLQLVIDHHSARTYTIGLWFLLLGALLVLQPQHVAVVFVAMLLLLAIGIDVLFRRWYDLFPRNPYARIAALLPLAILLGGIVFTGVDRYTGAYRYSPSVATFYSSDLKTVRKELAKDDAPSLLVVPQDQHAFYSILAKKQPDLVVTHVLPAKNTAAIVAAPLIPPTQKRLGTPDQLVTNGYSQDALRFYIYK